MAIDVTEVLESGKAKLLAVCGAFKGNWEACKENIKESDSKLPLSFAEFCHVNSFCTLEENKQMWNDVFPERVVY